MTSELVRKNLETSLELGSLKEAVRAQEVVMLLIDTSGSMGAVMANGQRRIDALRAIVADIRTAGHVPTIAFGGPYDAQVRFVDLIPEPDGGTPLHMAIPFAKDYGANRLVIVSDGYPDLHDQCRTEAQNFGGRIDVVFVGEPGEPGSMFLDDLAKLTGGVRLEGDLKQVKELATTIVGLLEGEVEKKAPIQGEGFTSVDEDQVVEADEDEDDEDEEFEEDDEDEDEEGDDDDNF